MFNFIQSKITQNNGLEFVTVKSDFMKFTLFMCAKNSKFKAYIIRIILSMYLGLYFLVIKYEKYQIRSLGARIRSFHKVQEPKNENDVGCTNNAAEISCN